MPSSCKTESPGACLRVLLLALAVRLLVLCLAFLSDLSFPDYDTSADFFPHICARTSGTPLSTQQQHTLSPSLTQRLIVWDSVFFQDISCNGYSHEQQFAFLPLLPALLRLVPPDTAPLLGLLLSTLLCVLSAALIFQLGLAITHCPRTSAAATVLFIVTPASIFYTAVYTESVFNFLTLLGLCALYIPARSLPWHLRFAGATAAFTLATAARANGIINAGFVLHEALSRGLASMLVPAEGISSSTGASKSRGGWRSLRESLKSSRLGSLPKALSYLVMGLLAAVLIAAPLVVHQTHARDAFCKPSTTHQTTGAQFECDSKGALGSRSDSMEWNVPGKAGSVGTNECVACAADYCSEDRSSNNLDSFGKAITPDGVRSSMSGEWNLGNEGKVEGTDQQTLWDTRTVKWVGHLDSTLRKAAQGLASSSLRSPHGSEVEGSSSYSNSGSQGCSTGVRALPLPTWCSASPWWRPSVYGYVQERYWGVGLFKYWKVQQIPNFLLALPALLLAAAACCTYAKRCPAGLAHFMSAGLVWRTQQLCNWGQHEERQLQEQRQSVEMHASAMGGYARGYLAPLVAHFLFPLAFMAVCAATVMHVQVGTRFLSSSPALYWFMADLWVRGLEAAGMQAGAEDDVRGLKGKLGAKIVAKAGSEAGAKCHSKSSKGIHWAGSCIWTWSLSYLVAGTVMFPNFYPWT